MAKVIGRPWPKGVSGNPKGRPKDQRTLEERRRATLEKYRRDFPAMAARLLQLEMRVDLLEGQVALTSDYADNVLEAMLRRDGETLLVTEPTEEQLAGAPMSDAEVLLQARTSNDPEIKRRARQIAARELKRRQAS